MASLRDIRKRIKSVGNSQKITKAMKMVAASKMRRAQDDMTSARPYAHHYACLVQRVIDACHGNENLEALHPLFKARESQNILLVMLTSDRGLCGAFNSSIIRKAEAFIAEKKENGQSVKILALGNRGFDYYKRRMADSLEHRQAAFADMSYSAAESLSEQVAKQFLNGDADEVFVLYNEFKSAISQIVRCPKILPFVPEKVETKPVFKEYIFEPNIEKVFSSLIPQCLATSLWQALLESFASEQAARMSAMDSATNNAKELGEKLTLKYNRARQASITQELMEIVGGAEALSA